MAIVQVGENDVSLNLATVVKMERRLLESCYLGGKVDLVVNQAGGVRSAEVARMIPRSN